ncbi:aminotransferase class V-fold PLP-dependent enzyme [Peribacillus sp. SCS-155]|uniref:aminotransferase class V-fold PLP-dependent enzyme n=1 Tax=Peribacillus sedimenti TaxID=3115297 RepID=UPI003905B440
MSNQKVAYDWSSLREQFNLEKDLIHIGSSQFISSHPMYIHKAIERYRSELDKNPTKFTENNEKDYAQDVRIKASKYLGMENPNHIALTDSATMGLGIIYTGLNLQRGQEILSSEHNHYSQQEAIKRATDRTSATYREIPIYDHLSSVTEEEIVDKVLKQIGDNTKAIGITWVHSDTGLKMPISKISDALLKINEKREESEKILLIVDGVHGFGIEKETFEELGCDFFITSGHKWLYGPRGTGLIAATSEAWQHVYPVIPSFRIMNEVSKKQSRPEKMDGKQMTPGGFHAMEHRWALKEAFEFMEKIGKHRIYNRVHELTRQAKEGLASMNHVCLHTPMEDRLSAGIIAFEVKGQTSKQAVQKLYEKKIVATVAPYRSEYVRITPGIFNTPEEIDRVLQAIQDLK